MVARGTDTLVICVPRLELLALATFSLAISACGDDTVVPPPALACEPGPTATTQTELCTVTIVEGAGAGGPAAVRVRRFGGEPGVTWWSPHISAGGELHLFGTDDDGAVVVAHLGLDEGDSDWSWRFLSGEGAKISPGPRSVVAGRVDLAIEVSFATDWLTNIDDGVCGEPSELRHADALGDANDVTSLARDGDTLVVLATSYEEPGVAYAQRRSLTGELLAEVELEDPWWPWILPEHTSARVSQPGRVLVSYSGEEPNSDVMSLYAAELVLDESLSVVSTDRRQVDRLHYARDLAGWWHHWWEPVQQDPLPPIPPTVVVDRVASLADGPSDPLELALPEQGCSWPRVVVRDESLIIVTCEPDLEDTQLSILGYVGSGEPSWTATITCPEIVGLRMRGGTFIDAEHVWLTGETDQNVIFELDL